MEESRENNFNLKPTPPKDGIVKDIPQKGNPLIITNILLTLLVVGLGVYIFMTDKKVKELEQESKDKENIVQEDTDKEEGVVEKIEEKENEKEVVSKSQTKNFTGKYIKAELPTGWEIVEYGNGEGTEFLMDGTNYTGLTGLKIHYNQKNILTMSAVDGFGSNECSKLPHFKDSSEKYENDMREMSEETGHTFELLDYTNGGYEEYKWFDRDIRRVGDTFHYDTKNNNAYFEPQCIFPVVAFETPLFSSDSGSPTMNSYQYELEKTVTKTVLEQLDTILKSMKVV